MDIKPIIDSLTAIVATATFVVGTISAKRSWDEKRRDAQRTQMERRQAEVRRLMGTFESRALVFNELFDYESDADDHLRITNLERDFSEEEVATRTRVDTAFEHLRDLYRSLRLGLIEADDLSFWTYWIHRVPHRARLAAYATACGYESFLRPLREWTANDPQLQELRTSCPWWPPSGSVGTAASGSSTGGRRTQIAPSGSRNSR